jgi:hypothetical protein
LGQPPDGGRLDDQGRLGYLLVPLLQRLEQSIHLAYPGEGILAIIDMAVSVNEGKILTIPLPPRTRLRIRFHISWPGIKPGA